MRGLSGVGGGAQRGQGENYWFSNCLSRVLIYTLISSIVICIWIAAWAARLVLVSVLTVKHGQWWVKIIFVFASCCFCSLFGVTIILTVLLCLIGI